jgi:acetyl-CoA acetyltransferase
MTRAGGSSQWIAPHGLWGPPAAIALVYQEYLQRYGATREDMATLLVQIRRNAARIPWAYWTGKPISREDYLNSRILADPISIHDCDIPVDGAAAFVLTSAARARDLKNRPVYIAGFAQGLPTRHQAFRTLDDMIEGGQALARRLWQSTGLGPGDIKVPQLYDGFSPLVYLWLESLGFCPVGEAHRFIQDGRIDVEGAFPLLSGGGSLGNGRLHGVPHMLECYLQLSKRAGERQLRRASTGIACHSFPNIGGAVVYSDEPY